MPKLAIPLTEKQIVGLTPKDRKYKAGNGIDPVELKRQQRKQAQAATPTTRQFHSP
jgi:hypothetical protein